MASDAAFLRLLGQYANAGSYNPPLVSFAPGDYLPSGPAKAEQYRVSASLSGTTLSLAAFATVSAACIKNNDLANYVEAAYTYTDAASVDHANVVRIVPGGILVVSSPLKISANVVLTAFGAACLCDALLIGA